MVLSLELATGVSSAFEALTPALLRGRELHQPHRIVGRVSVFHTKKTIMFEQSTCLCVFQHGPVSGLKRKYKPTFQMEKLSGVDYVSCLFQHQSDIFLGCLSVL